MKTETQASRDGAFQAKKWLFNMDANKKKNSSWITRIWHFEKLQFLQTTPHLAARCIHWVNKMKIRSHFGWKHNLPITIMLFQEICSCTFSVDAGQTRWSWMNEDAVCFSGRFGCHSEHSLTDNPRCFDRSPISTYLVLTMLRKSQDQSKAITLQKSFFI